MDGKYELALVAGITGAIILVVPPTLRALGFVNTAIPVTMLLVLFTLLVALVRPYLWRLAAWHLYSRAIDRRARLARQRFANEKADDGCYTGAFQIASQEGFTRALQHRLAQEKGRSLTVEELWHLIEQCRNNAIH